MANFTQAFREGIDAAKLMKHNRREIKEVFQDLNAQLRDISEGRVQISLKKYKSDNSATTGLSSGLIRAISMMSETLENTYSLPEKTAIFACNPLAVNSSEKMLADWEEGHSGYPCNLKFEGQEIICEDREALEQGLSEMLKEPRIGEKIFNLMNLSQPLPTSDLETMKLENTSEEIGDDA